MSKLIHAPMGRQTHVLKLISASGDYVTECGLRLYWPSEIEGTDPSCKTCARRVAHDRNVADLLGRASR